MKCMLLYSLDSPSCDFCASFGFDRSIGGFIETLPDSAAGLLHLKCVLTHMAFKVMASALEPD